MGEVTEIGSSKCFGGHQKIFTHESTETKCKMTFGMFVPPQAEKEKLPIIYWLSGLRCTHENFIFKTGFQQFAVKYGVIVINPDTGPRGEHTRTEGDEDDWDFGVGAGYYLDATVDKWKTHYRMYSYVTKELPSVVGKNFHFADTSRQGIMGHSMGGHGALTLGMKNPDKYRSISAFGPICNPMVSPWGMKALKGYLGDDKEAWKQYDACELAKGYKGPPLNILVDMGTLDPWTPQKQLLPQNLVTACYENHVPITYRLHQGYDHSYYFISSFMEEHIAYHTKILKAEN